MRCNQAVISAFLVHPQYCGYVKSYNILKVASIETARYASPELARDIIQNNKDKLVTQQARTGLWKQPSRGKKEDAYAISYKILATIHKAEMLDEIGTSTLPLRYDPFSPFESIEAFHGILVRRIFNRMLPTDAALVENLTENILAKQDVYGSWDGTVVATSLNMDHLLELGHAPDSPAIVNGAQWLLNQYRERVDLRGVSASSFFCSENPAAELESAKQIIPETIPVFACYGLLPFIPTGLALRILVAAGYINEPEVEASYASLLLLGRASYVEEDVLSLEGWCSHTCIQRLQSEVKIRQKMTDDVKQL